MKELLIGNHSIARGLYEGGLRFISGYPGTPSTEILEHAATFPDVECEWAPNEKVALEAVFGASLAGARAACTCKHVGQNVAADPLFTFSYTGVGGGAVICVADDPAMHSSQNEQDSRHYAIAAKLPMLEPSDSGEALAFAKAAFALSEQFDTPVLLRTCTRIAHSQSLVELGERQEVELKPYQKQSEKYVMMPAYAKGRHPVVEERMKALASFAEDCPFNRIEWGEKKIGIITSGTCYHYVKEVFGEKVSVLKLGLINPLPRELILTFSKEVERLIVIEELDGIIEAHCNCLGLFPEGKSLFSPIGELSQRAIRQALLEEVPPLHNAPALPARPPMMCSGCPHRGLFYVLSKHHLTVFGDIGCYTLGAVPPLSSLDTCLCMGASISSLHGCLKVRPEMAQQAVAVIGDSTFVHSGITSLIDMTYNQTNGTVIILDNAITGMTGHQPNPTTGYTIKGELSTQVDVEALCRSVGVSSIQVVDPYDLSACDHAIKKALGEEQVSVIILRRPCVLLKTVEKRPPLFVDTTSCKGCMRCMSMGCPSLSVKNGKAQIDATLCVGCKVCQQLCPFSAIIDEG
ncbi:MAG: indolepyruvate ferredoxin oxidoreductase subunit alpha [Clostridia bacterium]|nr:indolepyruvate ferredoxin oxidoreductase subunit alpha [Clostridia bacterium]